jgi:hypothetical protein
MDDASNQYSQMAIFKVGDDVRQVKEKSFLFSMFELIDYRIFWHYS